MSTDTGATALCRGSLHVCMTIHLWPEWPSHTHTHTRASRFAVGSSLEAGGLSLLQKKNIMPTHFAITVAPLSPLATAVMSPTLGAA